TGLGCLCLGGYPLSCLHWPTALHSGGLARGSDPGPDATADASLATCPRGAGRVGTHLSEVSRKGTRAALCYRCRAGFCAPPVPLTGQRACAESRLWRASNPAAARIEH